MDLRRNCLVIDDDKIALKLAASCCHELGLKVYVADTPTEAVDELKRRRYELLVVDHHVHGISGCEILDHLRSHVRGLFIDQSMGQANDLRCDHLPDYLSLDRYGDDHAVWSHFGSGVCAFERTSGRCRATDGSC